ncbi:hypothetical protein M8C21_015845 [Ambrosia artemisiifolia]|uniref:DUF4220 domain-containing protein n=1 Tax=Ambrosia artemisiifolia TaxID=4212 RepID=A0AAD5BNW4_AMBAR|nr:hypothetical protein M8C21_015845 [Ambrosia artemisiifolia]
MARMLVEIPIPPKWKQLWDTWDLRCFIVLSLLLQMFLIFVSPFRKRTKSYWIVMPLWTAYLMADATANFAVGLISNSMGNPGESAGKKSRTPVENTDLLAFWAPFLLVHLGGPDTITAFAMEDNELWLRHLLGLIFQCLAALYVFVQSLPDNRLWIPTTLMFVTGIIKYAERTRSLYLASADRFKESMLQPDADPGLNYAKLMDEYVTTTSSNLPTTFTTVEEPDTSTKSANKAKKGSLTDLEVVQYGYLFYQKFRGLIVDTIFSRKERDLSRYFFLNRNAKDAFKVIEVELNFIYEVLFTKLPVVYGKFGALCRVFSLGTVFLAIVIFILKGKSKFSNPDVTITYALLFGALGLDLTALLMLLFSDWTIIALRESPDEEPPNTLKNKIIIFFLSLRIKGVSKETKRKPKQKGTDQQHNVVEQTQSNLRRGLTGCMNQKLCRVLKIFVNRRWSETINTFNLIDYCLRKRYSKSDDARFCSKVTLVNVWEKVIDKLGVDEFLDSIIYVKPKTFDDSLRDFIFDELKSKSELADDLETAKEISSARGDWVLRVEDGWAGLLKYVAGVDYDQSLILWHIATDLLYNHPTYSREISNKEDKKSYKEISKLLSDYMLYLLIMEPGMMSAVAGIAQIRFRDTCAEAQRFFKEKMKDKTSSDQSIKHAKACKEIYDVQTVVPPISIKGDRSKSLLFDGCMLAKKIVDIAEELTRKAEEHTSQQESNPSEIRPKPDKWLIISKVWVELLCYAASHARANMQAAQVSRGGELVTIVWLLMSHFGLGEQFQLSEGQSRAKLVVGK